MWQQSPGRLASSGSWHRRDSGAWWVLHVSSSQQVVAREAVGIEGRMLRAGTSPGELSTCPRSCPETPPATPAPALAPQSAAGRRKLLDCKVKLGSLQAVLGFGGPARAALGRSIRPQSCCIPQRWGENRAGSSVVGATSGPEQAWLWVQEPKDLSGGMLGLSGTSNPVNKKGMSNMLISLATTRDERDSKVK